MSDKFNGWNCSRIMTWIFVNHFGKANKVTDTFNKKTKDIFAMMRKLPVKLAKKIKDLEVVIIMREL